MHGSPSIYDKFYFDLKVYFIYFSGLFFQSMSYKKKITKKQQEKK
jgi:hypothetical protein